MACSNSTATNSGPSAKQPQPTKSEESRQVEPHKGDLATRRGTATVREPYTKPVDDPYTTDDESNNQPLGKFGTVTLHVLYVNSGNSYPVDADVEENGDGYELHRLYFLKGGWVDFNSCDLDEDYQGSCDDENGRAWEIEGTW